MKFSLRLGCSIVNIFLLSVIAIMTVRVIIAWRILQTKKHATRRDTALQSGSSDCDRGTCEHTHTQQVPHPVAARLHGLIDSQLPEQKHHAVQERAEIVVTIYRRLRV